MHHLLQPSVAETPSSGTADPLGLAEPVDRAGAGLPADAGPSFDQQLQESSRAAETERAATARDPAESGPSAAEIIGNVLPPDGNRRPLEAATPGPGIVNAGNSKSVDASPVSPDIGESAPNPPPVPAVIGADTTADGGADVDAPVAPPFAPGAAVTDRRPRTGGGDSGGVATAASGSGESRVRAPTAADDPALPAQVAGVTTAVSRPPAETNTTTAPALPLPAHPTDDRAESRQRAPVGIDAARRGEPAVAARTGGDDGIVHPATQSKAVNPTLATPARDEGAVRRTGAEIVASGPRSRSPETLPTRITEAGAAFAWQAQANRGVADAAKRRGPIEFSAAARSDYVAPGAENLSIRRADSVQRFVTELQETGMVSGDVRKTKPPSALPPAQSAPVTSAVAPSLHSSSAPPAPQAANPVFTVNAPVLDPAWEAAVNDRVVWLAGRNIPSAEIRLNPAELGPLQVQLSVDEKAVNVTFNAAHAVTRDALESALPRLKDMLLENGMSLEGANVNDHGVGHRESGGEQNESASGNEWFDDDMNTGPDQSPLQRRSRDIQGLVDTYV